MADSSVIIPVHNLAGMTADCLKAVLSGDPVHEVIVVDDASTDETPEVLAGFGDRIRVVRHADNAGFSASCNDGAAVATGSYLVFLNNDTSPRRGWLRALEDHAGRFPAAAAVGAKLLYPDETIQHAGVVIGQDRYPRHLYAGFPANHPAVCQSRRFQVVTAACMLVRAVDFRTAGGFDTAFRNGFEDVDLCLRLGAAGREIHYCAESVAYHYESVSPGRFSNRRENVQLYRDRWLASVRPDDFEYYLRDGLLRVEYEGRYPVRFEVSPLLAVLDEAARTSDVERLLAERARQLADLQRENIRLRLDLGDKFRESPELKYQHMRTRVKEVVTRKAEPGSTLMVVSNGDGAFLDIEGYRAWHFPRTRQGAYAGHHPADNAEAMAHLRELRARGARYFLVPAPSLWWLDHYAELARHLEACGRRIDEPGDPCALFDLGPADQGGRSE